jgi:hypothetical protein
MTAGRDPEHRSPACQRTPQGSAAAAGSADIVDATVVASAASRRDVMLTSDPRDLRQLAAHTRSIEII